MDKNIKDDNNSDDVNEINEELLNELDDLSQKLIITTEEGNNVNSVNNGSNSNSNEIKVSNNNVNASENNDMNEPLNKAFKDLENNMAMLYETLSQTKSNNEHTGGSSSNSNPFIDNFNSNNVFPSSMGMDFTEMEKMFNMSEFSSLYDTFTKANASGDGVGANNVGADTLLTQDEQNKIYKDTLVYLISQNLLQELITNMKMSINECLRKNKDTLSNEDVQQYNKALKYAEDILNECKKTNPNLDTITDVFCKLQEITELDNIHPKQ